MKKLTIHVLDDGYVTEMDWDRTFKDNDTSAHAEIDSVLQAVLSLIGKEPVGTRVEVRRDEEVDLA